MKNILLKIKNNKVIILLLIVILLTGVNLMESLNPTDTSLIKYLKKTNNTVHELTTARQSYQGDWIELNQVDVSIANGDFAHEKVLTFVRDPKEFLNTGDRIRILRVSYEYFVVCKIDGYDVHCYGDTTTFPPSSDVSFSKLVSPIGWPSSFTFSPDIEPITGSGATITETFVTHKFIVTGNIVTVYGFINLSIASANTGTIYIESPIQEGSIPGQFKNFIAGSVDLYYYDNVGTDGGIDRSNYIALTKSSLGGNWGDIGTTTSTSYFYTYSLDSTAI